MPWQDREAKALPARRDAMLRGECLAHAFLQTTVRDARWACRLAPAALHASLHEREELVGDRRVVDVYGPDGGDTTTRRQRFLAGYSKSRAMRQAKTAADTRS